MKTKKHLHFAVLIFLLLLNIGCDQVTKHIVRDRISDYEQISIIQDRFTLTKVQNSGAFLSLGDEMPYIFRLIVLTGIPLIFLGYGLYYLFAYRNLSTSMQIALCFLLGGGIGNLYDRIVHGSVTDFMHMNFTIFQTGVFNFADVSIMIGVGMLLVKSFIVPKKATTDHLESDSQN